MNYFENAPAIRDAVGQLLMQETPPRYNEAVAVLRQASALAPDENTIREHYGMALFYDKQYREAAGVLQRLVDAKDDGKGRTSYANRADIRTAIGECQMEMDQPRDAKDNFEMATTLAPENVTNWLNLAKAALRCHDLKRGELSLKKAMSIDAKIADAHLLMGYLKLQQGKHSDALASFRKASTLDNGDAVSVCMTGLVLEKMGRSTEAVRYYSQALKLKPNDELATSLLAKVQVEE
jgi:Tfp pilus assembly protein PilF